MSVGTACVNDMYFLHERGKATGVYTIFVTNGAHVAALSKSNLRSVALARPGSCPSPFPMAKRLLILFSRRISGSSMWLAMGLLSRCN